MYTILWEYQVKEEKQSEFEEIYSPNGVWAKLFKKGTGYLGTELLRDEKQPQRYLTIDRWVSKENYEAFQSQWKKEYKALDAQYKGLSERESLMGRWIPIRLEAWVCVRSDRRRIESQCFIVAKVNWDSLYRIVLNFKAV
jgi:heme-degrading monooxygenase HmoA